MGADQNTRRLIDILDEQPPHDEIYETPDVEGHRHIPIAIIERNLQRIFGGLWKTQNFQVSEISGGVVVGSIDLLVWIPELGEWLSKSGGASFVASEAPDARTIVPALKSMCISNAASLLGRRFGADLNRSNADLSPLEKQTIEARIIEQVELCDNLADLQAVYDTVVDRNRYKALFAAQKTKILKANG